jgi:PAS domain S-box-containing protein
MFGVIDKTELVGKHVLNFTVKADKERAVQESMRMIMEDRGGKSSFRALTKDGKEIFLEVTTEFIRDDTGEKIGFIDKIRTLPVYHR